MQSRSLPSHRMPAVFAAAFAAVLIATAPARANPVPNHDYAFEIRPLHTSGKCLEVADDRTDNGAPVRLWDCSGRPNQQWRMSLDRTFPGRYFIRNVHSGKCLQIGFLSRVNGSSVNQWDCNGNPNERWSRTDRNPDPIAAERLNQGPALCLDVADRRTDDGAPLQVWSCHGAANQQWVWNLKL
ncbi:RICIN domain-containing protein [Streptomyces sp. NPDC002181]|uniref:RICIN domain-containing protein n=1 Tax=Streptomyces sp. NPDC002181 TaxID=3364635 RepID=UPI003685AFC6